MTETLEARVQAPPLLAVVNCPLWLAQLRRCADGRQPGRTATRLIMRPKIHCVGGGDDVRDRNSRLRAVECSETVHYIANQRRSGAVYLDSRGIGRRKINKDAAVEAVRPEKKPANKLQMPKP